MSDNRETFGGSEESSWEHGDTVVHAKDAVARARLVSVAEELAREKKDELDRHKAEHDQIGRPDFLWHYLLQSFATMGRAAGWEGLIGNKDNYSKVRYEALAQLSPGERIAQVERTCRVAKVRMPPTKARYITDCFEQICELGGPEAARERLLAMEGRDAKIRFLRAFSGIGPKYARNIVMDVYHEDFRDSIAIDARIQSVSDAWGLRFDSYEDQENFYLSVAEDAELNGWELDRLMFNFKERFLPRARQPAE